MTPPTPPSPRRASSARATPTAGHPGAPRRARAVAAAYAALAWERLARVIWPAAAAPAAYVVAALAGVWSSLGDPARVVAAGVAALATLGLAIRGLRMGPWPSVEAARRRVEADNALSGRPFEALDDRPSSADPATQALWRAHQARMTASLERVKAKRPRAALAAADRYALRGVLVLAGAASAAAAGDQAGPRLGDAFALEPLRPGAAAARVDAWITPPDYTGQAPTFLTAGDGGGPAGAGAFGDDAAPATAAEGVIVDAPVGSELVVRVVGGARRPRMRVITPAADQRMTLEPDGPDAFAATLAITHDMDVTVLGGARAHWSIFATPDRPPQAAFASEPEANARQELTFAFTAEDDYPGVSAVLQITRRDTGEAQRFDLTTPAADGAATEMRLDLTRHAWAGLTVDARVIARDARGQEGASAVVSLDMPARLFLEPLAQAIAHERATLMRDQEPYAPAPEADAKTAVDLAGAPPIALDDSAERVDRAPAPTRRVGRALDLLLVGADVFAEAEPAEFAIYTGLASASERVARAADREELAGVEDVLWDAALLAEGGELENARRALERAARALADALARGDDQAEIDRRVAEYRDAVDRYLELLTAEALAAGRVVEGGGAGGEMGADALQDMLQALDDLSATGSRDDARRLLQAMTDMLENLQLQLSSGGGGGTPPIQDEDLRNALEELGELQLDQRDLGDDIQRDSGGRGAQSPSDPGQQAPGAQPNAGAAPGADGQTSDAGGAPEDLADRQRALAESLERLQGGLEDGALESGGDGEGVEQALGALDRAGDAMRQSAEALARGDYGAALDAHGEALQALRDANTELAQQEFANREGGAERAQDAGAIDPLGRSGPLENGFSIGDDVEVPDQQDRERAREILDELRRRLSEGGRSDEEREYLRRLLEQF